MSSESAVHNHKKARPWGSDSAIINSKVGGCGRGTSLGEEERIQERFASLFHPRADKLALKKDKRPTTINRPAKQRGRGWVYFRTGEHLAGRGRIGYRLVHDLQGKLVAWVAAIDLDAHGDSEPDRLPDALALLDLLQAHGYTLGRDLWVERSKNGRGYHLWLFHAEPFEVKAWEGRGKELLRRARVPKDTELFPRGGELGGTAPWTPYYHADEAERAGRTAFIEPPSSRIVPLAEFVRRCVPAPASLLVSLPKLRVARKGHGRGTGKGRVYTRRTQVEPPPRIRRMMEAGRWHEYTPPLAVGPFPAGARNKPRMRAAESIHKRGGTFRDLERWNREHCGPTSDAELRGIWNWIAQRGGGSHAL